MDLIKWSSILTGETGKGEKGNRDENIFHVPFLISHFPFEFGQLLDLPNRVVTNGQAIGLWAFSNS